MEKKFEFIWSRAFVCLLDYSLDYPLVLLFNAWACFDPSLLCWVFFFLQGFWIVYWYCQYSLPASGSKSSQGQLLRALAQQQQHVSAFIMGSNVPLNSRGRCQSQSAGN